MADSMADGGEKLNFQLPLSFIRVLIFLAMPSSKFRVESMCARPPLFKCVWHTDATILYDIVYA